MRLGFNKRGDFPHFYLLSYIPSTALDAVAFEITLKYARRLVCFSLFRLIRKILNNFSWRGRRHNTCKPSD